MKIRPPRDGKAEAPCHPKVAIPGSRIVRAVVHLEPGQPCLDELRNQVVSVQSSGVGQGRHAAVLCNQGDDLCGARALMRHVGGCAIIEIAVEDFSSPARVS